MSRLDRLFWTLFEQSWARWKDVPVIVKPEMVVGWHRAGFRMIGVDDFGRVAGGRG